MSPKGRVIDLPNGATPLDFAYRIHTEVGHSTVGAIVNNTMVPLNTVLKTGDVVQIKTSKQSNGPSEDWLKIVKTSHARTKIKNFLQHKEQVDRADSVEKGRQLFVAELKNRGLDEKDYLNSKRLESVLGQFAVSNENDLYYAIAVKSLSLAAVMEKLTTKRSILDTLNFDKLFKPTPKRGFSRSGIRVAGVDSMMISLAGCCSPVPGDDIVGFISKGQGVKVHRADCPNIKNEMKRLIHVEWDLDLKESKYEVKLHITATDRSFLVSDLVTIVSQNKAGMNAINSSVLDDKITAITTMTVVVTDAEHLRTLMANLRKVDSVLNVERLIK